MGTTSNLTCVPEAESRRHKAPACARSSCILQNPLTARSRLHGSTVIEVAVHDGRCSRFSKLEALRRVPINFKCAYGSNEPSEHGFACPDHARLHAYVDHKVSFTDVNKHKGSFKGEYEEGCCVTQRFSPLLWKTSQESRTLNKKVYTSVTVSCRRLSSYLTLW